MVSAVNHKHRLRFRRGISLIEVIACTALVAIMMVPIAGVIRASAQSIAQSNGNASGEANLRTALRWVSQTVRDSNIVSIQDTRLVLRLPDASVGTLEVRRGELVLASGNDQTVLIENVRDIRFTALRDSSPSATRTGLDISLRTADANGNGSVTMNSIIAEPPQI
jgi:hypothetical protein